MGRTATRQRAPQSGHREVVSIVSRSGLDGKAVSAKIGPAPGVHSPANRASCGTASIPTESSRSGAISGARKSPAGSAGGTLFRDNGHTASSSLLHSARIVTTSFRVSKKPTAFPVRAGKLFFEQAMYPPVPLHHPNPWVCLHLGAVETVRASGTSAAQHNERIGDSQWEQWTRR